MLINPPGIAMPKGYILPLCFFLPFFSTKLGHIFTHDCYLKNLVRTPPGIYPSGWGKTVFGTDFELWPSISLQRNMTSTIGNKLVNLRGLPYMVSQIWRTLVQKRLRTVNRLKSILDREQFFKYATPGGAVWIIVAKTFLCFYLSNKSIFLCSFIFCNV